MNCTLLLLLVKLEEVQALLLPHQNTFLQDISPHLGQGDEVVLPVPGLLSLPLLPTGGQGQHLDGQALHREVTV